MKYNHSFLAACSLLVLANVPAQAQDSQVVTYTVERTIEPTDGGAGAEVTFDMDATITRDLSANGQQGYDIEAVRTQTVTTRDGDRVTVRQEIDGRGAREVTVERGAVERTERIEAGDKPARPDRPD